MGHPPRLSTPALGHPFILRWSEAPHPATVLKIAPKWKVGMDGAADRDYALYS